MEIFFRYLKYVYLISKNFKKRIIFFSCWIIGGSNVVQELKDAQLRMQGVRKISTSSDTSDPDSRMISSGKPDLDENGLVIPKKLYNPCMASAVSKDLRQEIKWNAKA